MKWIPCEEKLGTVGSREGHCATCLPEVGTEEEWVLCLGGYCEGERDKAVMASRVSELPVLRWVDLRSSGSGVWFECDGASLTRVGTSAAYLFGGLDAEMNRCNRLLCLALLHAEGGDPVLDVKEVFTTGDVPSPRSQHSAGGTATHLVVFGGETDDAEQTNDVYALCVDTLLWTHIRVGSTVPLPRLLAGPLVFVSPEVCILYGGAHFVNGDIKSFDDTWALHLSCVGRWTQLRAGVPSLFPRSNGHAGGLLRSQDGTFSVVFLGGKDAAEGCDKVKQLHLDDGVEGGFGFCVVECALRGGDGPHWRYTPAVAETRHGVLLLGGQCRHPQKVAAFLLRCTVDADMT